MRLKDRQKISKTLDVITIASDNGKPIAWRASCEGSCADVENHNIDIIDGQAYHTVRLDRSHGIFTCNCPGGEYVCKHTLAVVNSQLVEILHRTASFWLKEVEAEKQKRPSFVVKSPKASLFVTMRRCRI